MKITEKDFLDSIDATFPYSDPRRGRELALTALEISPNAVFGLVEELARPPVGDEAPVQDRLAILGVVREALVHPLAAEVLTLADRMIRDEVVSVEEAVAVMAVVAEHRGEYGALNIAYFSCDDAEGVADALYKRIVAKWEAG